MINLSFRKGLSAPALPYKTLSALYRRFKRLSPIEPAVPLLAPQGFSSGRGPLCSRELSDLSGLSLRSPPEESLSLSPLPASSLVRFSPFEKCFPGPCGLTLRTARRLPLQGANLSGLPDLPARYLFEESCSPGLFFPLRAHVTLR
jgi:hypothetical protein